MRCSQLAVQRKRNPRGSPPLLWVRGMEQDRRGNPAEWQKQKNDLSLPSELHSHPGLQYSLFPLCSPADLERSMVNCLKSVEGHQVTDGNCLVCFGLFSLSAGFTL